jgi:tetratricopeptide (TPR) repeat protein
MAPPDSISEYRRRIYDVGKTQAEKYLESEVQKKNKELVSLKKNIALNNTKIKQLEDELTLLEEQRKKVDEQAQELAKKYAPVNLDDASALFKEAFQLFQNGSLDSALNVLNQADLPNKVDSVLVEEKNINEEEQGLKKRVALKEERKKEYAEGLQLKADVHKTKYQFDSASVCYELLIKLDPDNAEYHFNYASFLHWLNKHDKAISYYTKALLLFRNKIKINPQVYEPDVAMTQNNLGALYYDQHAYAKAEQAYLEALEIRRRLAKENPQVYEPEVAATQPGHFI